MCGGYLDDDDGGSRGILSFGGKKLSIVKRDLNEGKIKLTHKLGFWATACLSDHNVFDTDR